MRRLGQAILILAGILLIIYPEVNIRYQDYQQQKLTKSWRQSMTLLAEEPNDQAQLAKAPDTQDVLPENLQNAMIGMLKIDKIDLEMPLLKGTNQENLAVSVTTVEPTGTAGQPGNLAIAGHNYFDYGLKFNRLGELAEGDKIEVETEMAVFAYKVMKTFYVNPDETWVLAGDGEKSLITLITCYPRKSPTQRLIVRGELIWSSPK